ncbi:MAG: threonine synthase [Lentisphaerae bacterium]|nr:threonine synthase [Lentisphaerota bacterium]
MRFISTRGGTAPLSFRDAVLTGLAPDGGLLLPEAIPDVRGALAAWRGLPYGELACEILRRYADIEPETLRGLVARSLASFRHPETVPVVPLEGTWVAELFHGPTLSFKDIALQFLGRLFALILAERGTELNIVGATSGDTGSAAIHGVRGRDRMRIFMMHPRGRISAVQERQMTTVTDANVFNLAVEGSFDDCQRILKATFGDAGFKQRFALGAVNSINWARLQAQIVYYFYAGLRVMDATGAAAVQFCVPTGNFGDIFAGYLAARMGLPVARLILATNANDILARFFNTGVYRRGPVHATLSPSMDIQVASNFERYLYYRAGEDPDRVAAWMQEFAETGTLALDGADGGHPDALFAAGAAGEKETLETIRETHAVHGYLPDPHTAVGLSVARRFRSDAAPTVCLATAHPAKFGEAIRRATGRDLAHHPVIEALLGLPTRADRMDPSVEALEGYIEEHARPVRDANRTQGGGHGEP